MKVNQINIFKEKCPCLLVLPHIVPLALPLVLAVVRGGPLGGLALGHCGGGAAGQAGHGGGGALGLVISIIHCPALLLRHCAALLHLEFYYVSYKIQI